eukprot:EG_transcript_11927
MASPAALVLLLAVVLGAVERWWLQWTAPRHRPGSIRAPEDPEEWLQNAEGLWLFTRQWTPPHPPSAVVFVLPGFGEHCSRYGYHHLASHLTAAGYAVVAMDHQGLGRSNGDRGFVHQFEEYVADFLQLVNRTAERWGPLPRAVVGHDLGGGVALKAVLQNASFDAVVLSAALVQPDPELETPFVLTVYRSLRWLPRIVMDRREHARMKRFCSNATALELFANDPLTELSVPLSTTLQMLRAAAEIRDASGRLAVPTLVLHGEADLVAKPEGSVRFFHALATPPDRKWLRLYAGALHDLFEEDVRDQVAADVVAFLRAVLPAQ